MIAREELERLVKGALPDAEVAARDLTGGQDHYELTVVSPAFEGRSLVERHRMVYAPLEGPLKGPLHALTLKVYTPKERGPRQSG
jgi:stress-induced morphogen